MMSVLIDDVPHREARQGHRQSAGMTCGCAAQVFLIARDSSRLGHELAPLRSMQ